MRLGYLFAAIALGACSGTPSDSTDTDDTDPLAGANDVRVDFPDAPWADPIVFQSGVYRVPAGTERQFCHYTTWTGDDTAIRREITYQSKYGHHFIIAGTTATEREFADGTTIDCTAADAPGMENFVPLLIGGVIGNGNTPGLLELPDGVATEITKGQRLVFQSHYLNTSAEDIVVQDELQLEAMPYDSVVEWAAPFVDTVSQFSIPTGIHSLEVRCTWDEDSRLLFVGGHMHEWGKSYSIDWEHADESPTEQIYNIPVWDPYMRDAPIYTDYTDAPLQVKAGDVFSTKCEWNNDTSEALGFPEEMCATFGMMLGRKVPFICDDGNATPF